LFSGERIFPIYFPAQTDRLAVWPSNRLQDETARVEDELLETGGLETLQEAFTSATGASFEAILEP